MTRYSPIENQYIKGLTTKLFISIIISSVSITCTVVATYYKMATQIANNTKAIQEEHKRGDEFMTENKRQDAELKGVDVKITRFEVQLDNLQKSRN